MKNYVLLLGAGLMAGAVITRAADVGDPVFPLDLQDKARAEVIYEHLNRKTDLDVGTNPTKEQKVQGDIFMARIHTDVGSTANLDFDLGGIGPSGSDFGFYVGLGIRMLVIDQDSWRLSAVAQGHYAPSLSGEVGGIQSDYHIWNADAELLLSGKIPLVGQVTVVPYIGPGVSIQRLDGESTTGSKEDISAQEKQVFGGVAGVSLNLDGGHTIRFEGRLFGSAEMSVAAGIAF